MKNIKFLLIALVATFALTACGGSDKDGGGNPDPTPGGKTSVVGQWHLTQWSVLSSADVYVSFLENGTFELYQRVYSPGYTHYSGRYTYKDGKLSGVYSDNSAWGNSYKVSFGASGTQMTLTCVGSSADISVFTKGQIPSEITSGEFGSASVSTRSDEEMPRFF